MNRTLKYTIEFEDMNSTVEGFLKKRGYSAQNITDLKKFEKGLVVNGFRANSNMYLCMGDELVITYEENSSSPKIPPVDIPIDIVYEDEDLVVVNKPADMPTHPSLNNYENTMANALMYYYDSKGESFVFRALNRLDRDTSGAVLVAKNPISGNMLSNLLKKGQIEKEYVAIVRGDLLSYNGTDSGIVDMPIGRVDNSTIEREVNELTGERAVTYYKVISYNKGNDTSYVSFHLETGRTHQIRVHMKTIGHPLVGDHLYDPQGFAVGGMTRQALHCRKISFVHPITNESVLVEIPLPKEMENMI